MMFFLKPTQKKSGGFQKVVKIRFCPYLLMQRYCTIIVCTMAKSHMYSVKKHLSIFILGKAFLGVGSVGGPDWGDFCPGGIGGCTG